MVDKSKLTKDVEEQIQSLASDVYIQVENKITNLIAAAVTAELSKTTDQQTKISSEKEQVLVSDIALLKQELADKQVDAEVNKQNFQVELTQKSINYTETIERLEKEIVNLKQQQTQQQDKKQSKDNRLDEKLLETEQNLNDKTQEVYGLNGRIMVLTEQEQSLIKQLAAAKEQIQLSEKQKNEAVVTIKAQVDASAKQEIDGLIEKLQLTEKQHSETVVAIKAQVETSAKQQIDELTEKLQRTEKQHNETVAAIKAQVETSAKQEIDGLTEKLQQVENNSVRMQTEALQSSDSKIKGLEQKTFQLTEQVQQQKNDNTTLQQQLLTQQKSIDSTQDKNNQAEQKSQDYQAQIIKITEQSTLDKQQLSDQIKAMNTASEQIKKLQVAAQQKAIELEKANQQLSNKLETEQNDIKLYQQEVMVLNNQLKVAQEGQDNILQRFNSNREKQETENNKVRETIKFLRDENHQLISDNNAQEAHFNDQKNELEHKLTEYRLKFEYAQKQLTR